MKSERKSSGIAVHYIIGTVGWVNKIQFLTRDYIFSFYNNFTSTCTTTRVVVVVEGQRLDSKLAWVCMCLMYYA